MILFRIDFAVSTGMGHFVRCLSIALQLGPEKAAFIVERKPAQMIPEAKPFQFFETLSNNAADTDAQMTGEFIRSTDAKLLVVDSYQMAPNYYQRLKDSHPNLALFAVDDFGEKKNLPLDGVLSFGWCTDPSRYASQVLKNSAVGIEYSPIRNDFLSFRREQRNYDQVNRMLVTMGGSDPKHWGLKILPFLERVSNLPPTTIVTGPLFEKQKELEEAIAHSPLKPRLNLESRSPQIAKLMSEADLILVASGTTCTEVAFLGTPMIAFPTVDNQEPIAISIERLRCGWALPPAHRLEETDFLRTLNEALQSPKIREEFAINAKNLVDGKGARRLGAFLSIRSQ